MPRLAAVGSDILDGAARGFRVEQDRRPRPALEQRTREQRDQPVGLVAIAALVNDADPVAVGVPGDAEVEAERGHGAGQIDHRRRLLGVGDAPTVGHHDVVNRVRSRARSGHGSGTGTAHDAVAGVDADAQTRSAAEAGVQHLQVVGNEIALEACARRSRRRLAAVGDRRDVVGEQRHGLRPQQLEAVVGRRVVAGGHDHPAAECESVDRPADHRRGAEPQRGDGEACVGQAVDRGLVQLARGGPRVVADCDGLATVAGAATTRSRAPRCAATSASISSGARPRMS